MPAACGHDQYTVVTDKTGRHRPLLPPFRGALLVQSARAAAGVRAPPSATRTVPVTKDESAQARNKAQAAISAG